MPPYPEAEFRQRLSEASQAWNTVAQAAKTLRQNLERPHPPGAQSIAFDRLEAATLDFQRRVLAAGDAAQRADHPASSQAELNKLKEQVDLWLGYLQANRTADPTLQSQRLRELLP